MLEIFFQLFSKVTKHNWSGSLTYEQAKKKLTNVDFDDEKNIIYFRNEFGFSRCDYDPTNIDLDIVLSYNKVKEGYMVDIVHEDLTKRSVTFYGNPHRIKSHEFGQIAELDDITFKVYFNQVFLRVYQFHDVKTVPFLKIFPIF